MAVLMTFFAGFDLALVWVPPLDWGTLVGVLSGLFCLYLAQVNLVLGARRRLRQEAIEWWLEVEKRRNNWPWN